MTASDRAVRIPGTLLGEEFPQDTVLPVVLFFWELLVQQLPQVYRAPGSAPGLLGVLSSPASIRGGASSPRAAPVGGAESLQWELR